ncbi:MAG: DUF885 domain-containing protein [Phycisphaerales bacterium]
MHALIAAAILLAGPLGFQPPAPPPPHPAPPAPPAAAVRAILDEHVEALKAEDPITASKKGDERFNDKLPDAGPEGVKARRAAAADRLKRLEAVDLAQVPDPDRTSAEILRYDLAMDLAGARFHPEHTPVSTMGGPQLWLPQLYQSAPFQKPSHYADYATRLESMPRLIGQAVEQMRLGLAAGRVPPRITMSAAVGQCRMHSAPDVEKDPTVSPFYRPFLGAALGDPQAARAREAIARGIVPAYRALGDFLEKEYIPRCRETVGISEGIDGRAAYDHALRINTTLDLTADEVHQTGLDEVARIRADMVRVIARTDFPRPPRSELEDEALVKAFNAWLRAEPRFYYTRAEDLLDGYRAIAKRVDPELTRLFRVLPRNPYGVRELPAFAAPSSPTAYYYGGSLRAGIPAYFMANTYRLDQRPRYSMIALTLHEAVPGHHLQIALADELEGQHEYHRWIGFNAFVEGWALYAERLGLEMENPGGSGAPASESNGEGAPPASGRGLYADPFDDFGRLSFEMWRACRLVIDTGLHAKGWSRQQAVDHLLANTGLAPHDAEREIDRYIGWPGQACGYKIGELKVRELRARAEQRLGRAFDIRAFHEVVLGAGAIPLPVLESRVNRWIERGGP